MARVRIDRASASGTTSLACPVKRLEGFEPVRR